MVFPRMRAFVAGALFVLWLGFLAYLAFANYGRIIVARPQLERSNLVVVAVLTNDSGRPAAHVDIQKVLYAEKPEWRQLTGQALELKELAFFSAKQGWLGAGEYVIPLTRRNGGQPADHVTLLPLSPGFYPSTLEVTIDVTNGGRNLAAHIAELVDVPVPRLRELFKSTNVTLWHVPWRTVEELEMLDQAIEKSGGKMTEKRRAESRIYRATPDVIEQVNRLAIAPN